MAPCLAGARRRTGLESNGERKREQGQPAGSVSENGDLRSAALVGPGRSEGKASGRNRAWLIGLEGQGERRQEMVKADQIGR